MRRLDVLGQHQHAEVRVLLLDVRGGPCPLVGERRRHADVEHHEVGPVASHPGPQVAGVSARGDDLVAAVHEEPGEALAQQDLVLGDHDSHGSSTVNLVPDPRSLSIRSVPLCAPTRSASPPRPEPRPGDAPPTPSSATHTTRLPLRRCALSETLDARACLAALVSPSQAMKKAAASTP
ncbi:MAG TPA: hypothetical protein VLB47_05075, partial [Solirubrobacteraceae bacterium]|nr:hypothetical protein [Solirubrobacteraceae bacterium]